MKHCLLWVNYLTYQMSFVFFKLYTFCVCNEKGKCNVCINVTVLARPAKIQTRYLRLNLALECFCHPEGGSDFLSWLEVHELCTKKQLFFLSTNICFADLLQQQKTQRADSHEFLCPLQHNIRLVQVQVSVPQT